MGAQTLVEPTDELSLVLRCREGDGTAWRSFYDRHFTFVLRSARRLGIPAAEAEDVTQDVFAIAFRKLDRFENGKASTWLYRICANVVSDHHRRRRVRSAFAYLFAQPAVAEPAAAEGALAAEDAQAQVSRILARMSAKKREIFALYEIEGLSGAEIAERVGCPLDTVWTRLFHARKEFARIGARLQLLEKARSA